MSEYNKLSPVKSHKDLLVFQRAYEISLLVHKTSLGFPKIEQFGGLGDQMRRASKSVCANLAEGFSKQRQSAPEFKRFLTIAIASADEMQVWLDYAADLGYLERPVAEKWQKEYSDIARMLSGLSKSWVAKKS